MKRRILISALMLLLVLMLAGCRCKHEWLDATCDVPKTCALCGQRQGEALGHSWVDAACDAPKTCTVCNRTEGEAPGHAWVDATCTTPKTCAGCGLTEGEPLSHSWVDATCVAPRTCALCAMTEGDAYGHSWLAATCTTAKVCSICAVTDGDPLGHSWTKADCTKPQTCLACGIQGSAAVGHHWLDATCVEPVRCEYCKLTQGDPLGHSWIDATPDAPKTCTVCGDTEGFPIEEDDRFVPELCQPLFGSWQYTLVYTAEDLNIPGFEGEHTEYVTYVLKDYGVMEIHTQVADVEAYKAMLATAMVADIYAAQLEEGRDAAAADAYWLDQYSRTIPDYARYVIETTTTEEDFYMVDQGVYYVSEGTLYTAQYWENDFAAMTFTLEGDTLTLTDGFTDEVYVCTRVV